MIRLTFVTFGILIGFLLGRCSRSEELPGNLDTVKVIDTVKLVDTVKLTDTLYVSHVAELKLVRCDTAFFRLSFQNQHSFKMEKALSYQHNQILQRQRLPSFAVGVGLGWYGELFPYIKIRYKIISGWFKPYRPLSGGVSLDILTF